MAKKKKSYSRGQTLGSVYRASAAGAVMAAPAIDALVVSGGGGGIGIGRDLAMDIYNAYRNEPAPIVGGIVTLALDDMVGQKVLNHNGALGRGSVTAWAGELAAAGPAAWVASQSGGQAGLKAFTGAKSGYVAGSGWDFGRMRFYLGAKYGLGVARKLSNMGIFKRVFSPVKAGLSSMGASL